MEPMAQQGSACIPGNGIALRVLIGCSASGDDGSQMAAGPRTISPEGEETLGVANRTAGDVVHLVVRHTDLTQLGAYDFSEVDVGLWAQGSVYRGGSGRRGKGCGNIVRHFEGGDRDVRTDGRHEIPGVAEFGTQAADRGFDDARHDASPTGVHRCHKTTLSVADQHGNAIGDSNAAGERSDPRYQAVARPVANHLSRIAGSHNAHVASMDLGQPDQLSSA